VEAKYNLADKDARYSVDPEIKVDSKVLTEETRDPTGKKLITIRLDH
jgi:hypothetical protein